MLYSLKNWVKQVCPNGLSILAVIVSGFIAEACATDKDESNFQTIKQAVVKTFENVQVESITPVSGGFSSSGLYKLVINDHAYAARFSNLKNPATHREREYDAMKKSAQQGIAPKVFYDNVSEGLILIEWIDNQYIYSHKFDNHRIKPLATQLKKLHDGPSFQKSSSHFTIARYMESLLKGVKPKILESALNLLTQLEKELEGQLLEKPCHNDLNPNNILYTQDKIFFIDWETARQNDPFFDICTLFIFYNLKDNEKNIFINTYYDRDLDEKEHEKLERINRVTHIYFGLAMLMVSQRINQEFLHEETINKLPSLRELQQKKNSTLAKTPLDFQEYGFAYLKEALL